MELRRTETGFALYKEKDVIGHCTLHPAAQGAALAALAIDPAWRRKGYGSYLLKEVLRSFGGYDREAATVFTAPLPADCAEMDAIGVKEVTVTLDTGKVLKITDQATLLPYLTKNIVRLEDLRPGTRILVWSDSDGAPAKVLVFPYEYRGYVNFFEDGTVTLNGAALSQKAKVTAEGETLLPIRAVAEALGMKVHWDADKGAVVSYSETLAPEGWTADALLTAMPGGAVYGYESDGTAYEAGGTCVIEDGVTYLSQSAVLNLLDLYPAL